MVRAPCCEKEGLKKGRWTDEEDDILTSYIQAYGEGSWRSVPKNAGLQRCGKSCRLRWINYLRPDLMRGNISHEEEVVIIRLHASMGNRWSLIAGHLPGRTDNEIKNYWNSHLSRKILTYPTASKAKAFEPKPSPAELTTEWTPRRGRSRQLASRNNWSALLKSTNRSRSTPENEDLEPITKDKNKTVQPDATEESFVITEYINDEGKDNTTSLNAEDSLIFSSTQKPSYFTDDSSEILGSLETEVNLSTQNCEEHSLNQKNGLKVSSMEVDTCAASWNESKSCSEGDGWRDWDWKGLVNCHELIDEDEDEMLCGLMAPISSAAINTQNEVCKQQVLNKNH